MNRQPDYFYGIDIGGTKMELAACDANFNVRYRHRVATPVDSFDAFVTALAGLVAGADAELDAIGNSPEGLAARAGEGPGAPGNSAARPRAPVGLGVPGIVDAGGAHLSANVPCLTGRQLLPVLRAMLNRPLALGNDCQCFALSEAHGGAAHGVDSMLGLIIGTGAGAGYVVDGRLVRGRNGVAGEWGHWPLSPAALEKHGLSAWPCACGHSACLECYVSGTGLRRLHGHVGGTPGMAAEELAARAHAGDAAAGHVLAVHVDLLGAALARIVLAYDPHAIVLGGGLSRMPHLYAQLPDAVRSHLLPGLSVPPILPPAFGDAGGARGAALLARQAYLTNLE